MVLNERLLDGAILLEPRTTYDPCILGMVYVDGQAVVLYDTDAIISAHMSEGMTDDEAAEWVSYNTLGAWFGPRTPAFTILWHADAGDCREAVGCDEGEDALALEDEMDKFIVGAAMRFNRTALVYALPNPLELTEHSPFFLVPSENP